MTAIDNLLTLEKESRAFGFDWPDVFMILDQAISECEEIRETFNNQESSVRQQEEIGDLLHTALSLCVFAGFSVEETLNLITKKFKSRLEGVYEITKERGLSDLRGYPTEYLMEIWQQAKTRAYGRNRDSF